jgi:hypothetical protein
MPEVNFQPKSPKYIKYIGQCVLYIQRKITLTDIIMSNHSASDF